MNWIDALILGAAVWRMSSLLVDEDGPAHMFRRLRERVGIVYDDDGNRLAVPDTLDAGALSCVWCASVWVSGVVVALWVLTPDVTRIVAAWLAFSTLAVLIDKQVK